MKQFCIFLLIVSITGQAFVRTAWTLHYQWNRAVYLEQCENRDKPKLNCDGKCHLKKKIAASENATPNPKAPSLPAGFRQIHDIQLYFESFEYLPRLVNVPARLMPSPSFYGRFLPEVPLDGIFRPPAA